MSEASSQQGKILFSENHRQEGILLLETRQDLDQLKWPPDPSIGLNWPAGSPMKAEPPFPAHPISDSHENGLHI